MALGAKAPWPFKIEGSENMAQAKKQIQLIHIVLAIAAVFVLSQVGVLNSLFAVTNIQCTSDAECPAPNCVGTLKLGEYTPQDCASLNGTDAAACSLSEWWYNSQNELSATKCVDPSAPELNERGATTGWHKPIAATGAAAGVCETSPYCVASYDDITNWVRDHPFAWIRDHFALALGAFALLVLMVYLLYTP
jgi:hypothetical protein